MLTQPMRLDDIVTGSFPASFVARCRAVSAPLLVNSSLLHNKPEALVDARVFGERLYPVASSSRNSKLGTGSRTRFVRIVRQGKSSNLK